MSAPEVAMSDDIVAISVRNKMVGNFTLHSSISFGSDISIYSFVGYKSANKANPSSSSMA